MTAPHRALAAATLALLAFGAHAHAQPKAPLGDWVGPGLYCAYVVKALAPEGYEAISFGNGVELRPIGGSGDAAELQAFIDKGRMPEFEGFKAAFTLDCPDGSALSETIEARDVAAGRLQSIVRRCQGPGADIGFGFTRADFTIDGVDYDATVFVWFGDRDMRVGEKTFQGEKLVPAEDGLSLFYAMSAALSPCETP